MAWRGSPWASPPPARIAAASTAARRKQYVRAFALWMAGPSNVAPIRLSLVSYHREDSAPEKRRSTDTKAGTAHRIGLVHEGRYRLSRSRLNWHRDSARRGRSCAGWPGIVNFFAKG